MALNTADRNGKNRNLLVERDNGASLILCRWGWWTRWRNRFAANYIPSEDPD